MNSVGDAMQQQNDRQSSRFQIKDGYRVNLTADGKPLPYEDTVDASHVYQTDVYRAAATLISREGLKNVADVGCGLGTKLKRFILPVCNDIVGFDCPRAIEYCRGHYDFGEWVSDDFEAPVYQPAKPFDLVISADVIEHLSDPDTLLRYIDRLTHRDSWIIISTPERDRVRGTRSMGPPENLRHVREWNSDEFQAYMSSKGLRVLEHRIVHDRERSAARGIWQRIRGRDTKTCQMAICRPDAQTARDTIR